MARVVDGPRRGCLSSTVKWLLFAAAAHSRGSVFVFVAADDTCLAGDTRAGCRSLSDAERQASGDALPELARQDLIAQELEELEGLLQVTQKQIALLERLQKAVREDGRNDLDISAEQLHALRAEVPLVDDMAAQAHVLPSAASEDYVTSKIVIRMDEPTTLIRFLPVRASSKYSSGESPLAPPPALLVTVGPAGRLGFYAASGEKLLTVESGHERAVTLMAVSPTWAQGDTLIATGDVGGVVRVHRVTLKQRDGMIPRDEDMVSLQNDTQCLGTTVASSVNVSVHFHRQLEALSGVDGDIPSMTALAMASQQGSKYFVVGDAEGKISVFTLGGAFKSRMDATFFPGHGIDSFYVYNSQLLFRAGPEWGYIDLEKLEVKHIECPDFDGGQITAAIIDSQHYQRVLAADQEGTLWSFVVRHARSCRVERKFPRDISRAPVDLASIRGFVLALERGQAPGSPSTLMALNLSHVRLDEDMQKTLSPVVWKRKGPPVSAWAVYRHRQDGPASDLVALLSEDGKEVEILELLMTINIVVAGQPIWLNGWVTLPIIIGAVLIIVFWHYLKYGRLTAKAEKGEGESTGGEGVPPDIG